MTKQEADEILDRNPAISALLNGLWDDQTIERFETFKLYGGADERDATVNWLEIIRLSRVEGHGNVG